MRKMRDSLSPRHSHFFKCPPSFPFGINTTGYAKAHGSYKPVSIPSWSGSLYVRQAKQVPCDSLAQTLVIFSANRRVRIVDEHFMCLLQDGNVIAYRVRSCWLGEDQRFASRKH